MDLIKKYTTKITEKPTKPGCWSYLTVEVLCDGQKVGEYERNYAGFYNTFYPFERNEKHYALYSKDYQTTSMSLPDCTHIADTEIGFCPVDFYVPFFDDSVSNKGLVSGCVWGDDSGGWKLLMLDLSEIESGKIRITKDFGYFQLPPLSIKLSEMIYWDEPDRLTIPLSMEYQIDNDEEKSGFFAYPMVDLKMYRGDEWKNFEFVEIAKPEKVNQIKKKTFKDKVKRFFRLLWYYDERFTSA